jgi:hypothetical protein
LGIGGISGAGLDAPVSIPPARRESTGLFSSIFLFVDELLDLDESDAGDAAESGLSGRCVSSSLRFVSNREKSGAFLDLTVSPKIFSRAIDVEAVAFAGFAHVAYQLLVFRTCCAPSEAVHSDPGAHARGQMKRKGDFLTSFTRSDASEGL